jgi:hypothetical protein
MIRHALACEASGWILAGGILAALLLSRFTGIVQVLPSALVWTVPWTLLTGWPSSPVRSGLAAQLELTWAGSGSTRPAEILLPTVAAAVPAVLCCYVTGLYGLMYVPWQTYVTIPFSALLASSAILMVETRYVHRGRALLVLLYSAQFLHSPGTGVAGLLIIPGYTLYSLQWGNGTAAGVHGDTWMALAVFTGLLMTYVAGRFSK